MAKIMLLFLMLGSSSTPLFSVRKFISQIVNNMSYIGLDISSQNGFSSLPPWLQRGMKKIFDLEICLK